MHYKLGKILYTLISNELIMPTVNCTVGLTIEQWEKTRRFHLNRSAIARRAIQEAIEEIESGDNPTKSAAGTTSETGGHSVICSRT